MGTVGLLLMDCWMYISFAISSGLVNMLFCLSVMESRGDVSEGLKTFLFIFLGLFSYIWRYFDTAFRIQCLVYFVVIFLASLLEVFAIAAMVLIHSFGVVVVVGGCGICTFWWLRISFKMGWVCQCGLFLAI